MSKNQVKSFPDRFDAFFENLSKKYPALFSIVFVCVLYLFLVAHCHFMGYVGGAR